jgi:tetratricopeptide (TPR) repeat protein
VLNLRLTGEQIDRLTRRNTDNSAAYWAYLKGRYYWGKRSPEGFTKALEYFQYASENDPNYSLAYSGIADCYSLLGYYAAMPPKTGMVKAKAAALKALETDEASTEAHASMGLVKFWFEWDWKDAEREFERAIELNPSYATAHQWYSWLLVATGRLDRAIETGRLAVELDPLAPPITLALGKSYLFAGRVDEAIEQCKRTLELEPQFIPAHYFLAEAYEQKGRYLEALDSYRTTLELTPGFPLGRAILARAQALAGQTDKAKAALAYLLELLQQGDVYVPAYGIALVYIGLGEQAKAMEWLQRAYSERFIWLVYLNVDPIFNSVRNENGFKQLTKLMRLPRP